MSFKVTKSNGDDVTNKFKPLKAFEYHEDGEDVLTDIKLAVKESERGVGVHKAKDIDDLFSQLENDDE